MQALVEEHNKPVARAYATGRPLFVPDGKQQQCTSKPAGAKVVEADQETLHQKKLIKSLQDEIKSLQDASTKKEADLADLRAALEVERKVNARLAPLLMGGAHGGLLALEEKTADDAEQQLHGNKKRKDVGKAKSGGNKRRKTTEGVSVILSFRPR